MTTRHASNTTAANNEVNKDEAAASCCGGPAPADTNACCVQDAVAKAAGEAGCGCGPKTASAKKTCC